MARRTLSQDSLKTTPRQRGLLNPHEIKLVASTPQINIIFDSKLLGAIFCVKYIYERNSAMAISAWMQWVKNDKQKAKEQSAKTNTILIEEKETAKKFITDYQKTRKITASSAIYLNMAVEHIVKIINSENFYLIYYFCFELNFLSTTDFTYLKEVLARLQDEKYGECFNKLCFQILNLVSRQNGELLPKNHYIEKGPGIGLNKLVVWMLRETSFAEKFMPWVKKQNFPPRSYDSLKCFIITYTKVHVEIKELMPLNFDNNPVGHAVYLSFLADQKCADLAKMEDYLKTNKLVLNPDQMQTALKWLMLLPKYHWVAQLFVWYYPCVIPLADKNNIFEFYYWLVKKPDYSVLNNGFAFNESGLSAKRGLTLYDSLHSNGRSNSIMKNIGTHWRKKILECQDAALIMAAYRDNLMLLTRAEYVNSQLLADLNNFHVRVNKAPKPEKIKVKSLPTKETENSLAILKENITQLPSPYNTKLISDFKVFEQVYGLTKEYYQIIETKKTSSQLAIDDLKGAKHSEEILEHISGVSRVREAELWLTAWFLDADALKAMIKNPGLCQEILVTLGYTNSVLSKLPRWGSVPAALHEDEKIINPDGRELIFRESEVFLKIAEFFCSLSAHQQYQVFHNLVTNTCIPSKAPKDFRPPFYLISYLLVKALAEVNKLRIGAKKIAASDFLKVLEKIHLDNRDEFLHYYCQVPNFKRYKKLVETRFMYVSVKAFNNLSDLVDKLVVLEAQCIHRQGLGHDSQSAHPALQAILIYTSGKSAHEIAEKLFKPIFTGVQREKCCDSLRIAMLLKWPLSFEIIEEQKGDNIFNRILAFIKQHSTVNRSQLIEMIRAEVIFYLIAEDKINFYVKMELIDIAPKYILLQDPHRLAGVLITLLKRLLDMVGSADDFLEKIFGNGLTFFQKFSGKAFKKILSKDKRLKAVATAISNMYQGKLWLKEELGSIEGIFGPGDGRFQGTYTELTTQTPEWLSRLTNFTVTEGSELSPSSHLSISHSPMDMDCKDPFSPTDDIKITDQLQLQSLSQHIPDYLKKNSVEKIRFFDSLSNMSMPYLLFSALILGLPDNNDSLSTTHIYRKYKKITDSKKVFSNSKTVAALWEIIDQINKSRERIFYINNILKCFDQTDLFASVKLESSFDELYIYLSDIYETNEFLLASQFLLTRSIQVKSTFYKFFIKNSPIMLRIIDDLFPENEMKFPDLCYSKIRDFKLFEMPEDTYKQPTGEIINTLGDVFAVLNHKEQLRILKEYFFLNKSSSLQVGVFFLGVLAYQACDHLNKFKILTHFLEKHFPLDSMESENNIIKYLEILDRYGDLKYHSLFLRIYLASYGMLMPRIISPLDNLLKRNSLDFLQILLLTGLTLNQSAISEGIGREIISNQIYLDHSFLIITANSCLNLFNSCLAASENSQDWILIEQTLLGIINGSSVSLITLSSVVNELAENLVKSLREQKNLQPAINSQYQSCINIVLQALECFPSQRIQFDKIVNTHHENSSADDLTCSLVPSLSMTLCAPPPSPRTGSHINTNSISLASLKNISLG